MRYIKSPKTGFREPVLSVPPGVLSCYVAGPEGFNDASRYWLNTILIPFLREIGLHVFSPWELTHPSEFEAVMAMPLSDARDRAYHELGLRVARRNRAAMERAGCMVASCEGPDVDGGTACEMGWYAARHRRRRNGRPIVAYRTDWRQSGEEGAPINPQILDAILESGGQLLTSFADWQQAMTELVHRWPG